MVSGFSPAAGKEIGWPNPKKKLMNVEHRTSNIERRMIVFCLVKKRFREASPLSEL
jgi:hypothetical protein